MQKTGAKPESLLRLLEQEGGISEEAVGLVAERAGVAEAEVWGVGSFYGLLADPRPRHRVCDGLSCRLAGADKLVRELEGAGHEVEPVSCLAQCDRAPAALDPDLELTDPRETAVLPDDDSLPINLGGTPSRAFDALARARELGPDRVLDEIEISRLQGRGGAAFPAHRKWRSVRSQRETERLRGGRFPGETPLRGEFRSETPCYVVCNADEGEPGTFKDREVLLRRPDRLLEGLAIAAGVIGADEVFVYVRGEFQEERRRLEGALSEAAGALGDLEWHVVSGHGAYVCGEETALLRSMAGRRGTPAMKPPFPTEQGFRGKPTLVHNVETAACVPAIINRGGRWFHDLGRTEPGTKLYSVSGHVGRPGVYELPLGVSLDELVEVAGGYTGAPRAFCPGGASSGFLPMSSRETPLDYGSVAALGSMLGSGGVVVLDESADIAGAVRTQLLFFERESCGQCAPCRIGTRYLRRQLDAFIASGGRAALEHASDVAWEMEEASLCGLGVVAAKPLESARLHFPDVFAGRGER